MPLLCTVTVIATDELPTTIGPNAIEAGDTVAAAAAATPTPLTPTPGTGSAAVDVMFSVALLGPTAAGVNTTAKVQLPCAPRPTFVQPSDTIE